MGIRGKAWTPAEDAILESLYPEGGVAAVKAETGRSKASIVNRAAQIGVSCDWARIAENAEPLTPVPRMDDGEKLACRNFNEAFAELDKSVNRQRPLSPAVRMEVAA